MGPPGDPDYYTLLGVPANATEAQILRAFRHAALVHHPDRGGDAETFRRLYQARETLLDPSRRAAHDRRHRDTGPTPEPETPSPAPDDTVADPFDWTPGAGPSSDARSSRADASAYHEPFSAFRAGYSWRRSDRFAWWRAPAP
ncbi:J domain-containing protein [Micromonospora zingiberis]|uniref:J domain-containing protein n=1 Tax=Micromonospora zingiberis TaxID=2053011 RepID=A0A4R0GKL1_9ACTN|nr:J domain-containing protein [Micromonospora zingiberis]TCB96903.1 J domain-containing protein [Micromonospora zingiberis]